MIHSESGLPEFSRRLYWTMYASRLKIYMLDETLGE